MGNRKAQPRDWWETETAFIEREGRKTHPMGEFASYCDMQAKFARADGFADLSDRIIKAKK